MTVVLERPYEFVPPHRGNLWPKLIQSFRLIDWHLRRTECVVDHECRNLDRFAESVRNGNGVMLTPNHCRYADPIVLGWPGRSIGTHLYAMAAWHLFNTTAFEHFALRRMGAFSVHRETSDKQSLDTAVNILTEAQRPLIVFPEGTTNRTNDTLKPLLDGVAFMARTAARRRAKQSEGDVVIHPVALKYLCLGEIQSWAAEQLAELELRLGWHKAPALNVVDRTIRLVEGMLALKEIEYTGRSSSGELPPRRDALMYHLLETAESALGLNPPEDPDVRARVRLIRAEVVKQHFRATPDQQRAQKDRLQGIADQADFAQNLLSFPESYLTRGHVTDTKLLETIQRIQESIYGKASETMPLKVIIDFGEAIPVPPERAPKGERDPVMLNIEDQLSHMIRLLAEEAKPIG